MVPAFHLLETQEPYNRIGQVRAKGTIRYSEIGIDPDHPVFYFVSTRVITAKSAYTNLVYRGHFAEQSYSLVPFHFGAGSNVGLPLPLDPKIQGVLVTTTPAVATR